MSSGTEKNQPVRVDLGGVGEQRGIAAFEPVADVHPGGDLGRPEFLGHLPEALAALLERRLDAVGDQRRVQRLEALGLKPTS